MREFRCSRGPRTQIALDADAPLDSPDFRPNPNRTGTRHAPVARHASSPVPADKSGPSASGKRPPPPLRRHAGAPRPRAVCARAPRRRQLSVTYGQHGQKQHGRVTRTHQAPIHADPLSELCLILLSRKRSRPRSRITGPRPRLRRMSRRLTARLLADPGMPVTAVPKIRIQRDDPPAKPKRYLLSKPKVTRRLTPAIANSDTQSRLYTRSLGTAGLDWPVV